MRRADWQYEIEDAKRREDWALVGHRRLVKVLSLADAIDPPKRISRAGFFTQEKFLLLRTSDRIERDLGLRRNELLRGCRVYRLARLPVGREYSYELTAAYPNGLAFNPADALEAERQADLGRKVDVWPPGAAYLHQWVLTVQLEMIPLIDLAPGQPYPRDLP